MKLSLQLVRVEQTSDRESATVLGDFDRLLLREGGVLNPVCVQKKCNGKLDSVHWIISYEQVQII